MCNISMALGIATGRKFLTPRGRMAGLMRGVDWISLTLVHRYVSALSPLLSTALYSWWTSLMEITSAITVPIHTHLFIVICLESWRLSWQIFQRVALVQPYILKKRMCYFCLIVLESRRQVLPFAGCAPCLTEQCKGPGLSYSRTSQVDKKKKIHCGCERGIFNPLGC